MAVTSLIEFDDDLEHTFNSNLEISDDKGKLKNIFLESELMFFNFGTDNNLNAKRGAYQLVFSGVNGDVSNGFLNLDDDNVSRAKISNVQNAGLENNFSFRMKLKVPFVSIVTEKAIFTLKSNADLSQVRFYFTNQGSGVTRINREIKDNLGNIISNAIVATIAFSVGHITEIAFSYDSINGSKTYLDGVLKNSTALYVSNMSNCDVVFGGITGNSFCSYDDFQLWVDEIDLLSNGITPEPTDFSIVENAMITDIPFLMDELNDFIENSQIPVLTFLKHFFIINLNQYWFNGNAWVASNGKLEQSNTSAEIKANLQSFPLVKGIGGYVQIAHVFKSDSGYATPLLESIQIIFGFKFKPDELKKCIVYGTVVDNQGNPVQGAIVEIDSKDKFYNSAFVGPKAEVITNEQGKFAVGLIETETTGTSVNINIKYNSGKTKPDGSIIFNIFSYKNRIIPNFPSRKINELIELVV